jgi:hypothetical protein
MRSRDLGTIGDGSTNIVRGELRIRFENPFNRLAAREEVENKRDPDARASDARLAKADVWVDRNSVKK